MKYIILPKNIHNHSIGSEFFLYDSKEQAQSFLNLGMDIRFKDGKLHQLAEDRSRYQVYKVDPETRTVVPEYTVRVKISGSENIVAQCDNTNDVIEAIVNDLRKDVKSAVHENGRRVTFDRTYEF